MLEDDLKNPEPDFDVIKSVKENEAELKKQYLNVKVAQTKYKANIVPAADLEAAFNDENSVYRYNDVWLATEKNDYQRIHKAVSAFLRKVKTDNLQDESKTSSASAEEATNLIRKIKLEVKQVETSLSDTFSKLSESGEINFSQAQMYNELKLELMNVVDIKIPKLLKCLHDVATLNQKVEVEEVEKLVMQFEEKQKPKLYKLVHSITDKIKHVPPSNSSHASLSSRAEVVHLKKVDPPSFSGKEEDFPEFHRKWLAIVGPARLPAEAEIDRLREALPIDARYMLTGVLAVSNAWDILKKRFGDEDLIAIKLKNELKSLVIKGKQDHEKVIALVIKVRSLVIRLEQLKASKALRYDGAVYFQLPSRHKQDWLKFDKSSYKDIWVALMTFLEEIYDKAVQEKLLLASLHSSEIKNGRASSLVANLVENDSDSNSDDDDKENKRKQKFEEARQKAGNCPLCLQGHTFKTRWTNQVWPSDRLIVCKRFNDMSAKERGETIERVSGCPRCTSWTHNRSQCMSQVIDCQEFINGAQCHKDHSRSVCSSGVAYCS